MSGWRRCSAAEAELQVPKPTDQIEKQLISDFFIRIIFPPTLSLIPFSLPSPLLPSLSASSILNPLAPYPLLPALFFITPNEEGPGRNFSRHGLSQSENGLWLPAAKEEEEGKRQKRWRREKREKVQKGRTKERTQELEKRDKEQNKNKNNSL